MLGKLKEEDKNVKNAKTDESKDAPENADAVSIKSDASSVKSFDVSIYITGFSLYDA